MNIFAILFHIVAEIIAKYPILVPIVTLVGIVSIILSAILDNPDIGWFGLGMFSGVNLAILCAAKGNISLGEIFIFLSLFILVMISAITFVPKFKFNPEIEAIVFISAGLAVAPVLISIRVINQIKRK